MKIVNLAARDCPLDQLAMITRDEQRSPFVLFPNLRNLFQCRDCSEISFRRRQWCGTNRVHHYRIEHEEEIEGILTTSPYTYSWPDLERNAAFAESVVSRLHNPEDELQREGVQIWPMVRFEFAEGDKELRYLVDQNAADEMWEDMSDSDGAENSGSDSRDSESDHYDEEDGFVVPDDDGLDEQPSGSEDEASIDEHGGGDYGSPASNESGNDDYNGNYDGYNGAYNGNHSGNYNGNYDDYDDAQSLDTVSDDLDDNGGGNNGGYRGDYGGGYRVIIDSDSDSDDEDDEPRETVMPSVEDDESDEDKPGFNDFSPLQSDSEPEEQDGKRESEDTDDTMGRRSVTNGDDYTVVAKSAGSRARRNRPRVLDSDDEEEDEAALPPKEAESTADEKRPRERRHVVVIDSDSDE